MAGNASKTITAGGDVRPSHISEPGYVKWTLIIVSILFLTFIVLMPLILVIYESFRAGIELYLTSLVDEYTLAALSLTILVALIVVPLNTIFGICAAWAITKFQFKGKNFLISLIDLPFSVSPVIAGLIYVLLLGSYSTIGGWLEGNGIQIIFATPGIILATLFITFPFVARELIPLMQAQGVQEEEAAASLGASGWRIFWRVTLPNIKWGLLYGMILCNARAIGEFGAVSVVSGHISGETNTLPLHVEILYKSFAEGSMTASFAVSSLLVFIALITILLKGIIEWRTERQIRKEQEVNVHG
jgi:sulfate transport system permease protein